MDIPASDIQAGYDLVAEQYATEFFEELKRKPFDCELLDKFGESTRNKAITQGISYAVFTPAAFCACCKTTSRDAINPTTRCS